MIPDHYGGSCINKKEVQQDTLKEYKRLKSEYGHIADLIKEAERTSAHIQDCEKKITSLRDASDKHKATLYDIKSLAYYESLLEEDTNDKG